jgi:hypothetical protein
MLNKMLIAALFLCGILSVAHSQEQEAVIKLDSPEAIAEFQKMLDEKAEPVTAEPAGDLEKALSAGPKSSLPKTQTPSSGNEFKVYKPQPKEAAETQDILRAVSDSDNPPKKIEAKESGFNIYKPQAREAGKAVPEAKSKVNTSSADDGFKVFIPQAKEEPEQDKKTESSVKSLDSPEGREEFEELLRKHNLIGQ